MNIVSHQHRFMRLVKMNLKYSLITWKYFDGKVPVGETPTRDTGISFFISIFFYETGKDEFEILTHYMEVF
jgi:hypothetical protein